jgi:adenine-specific DNA-methyltransferase
MTISTNQIIEDVSYVIKNAETLQTLKKIEAGKFDLILSSPPYNVGKEYETKTSIEKYLETQEAIIAELVRTLSDKGNLCWQIGNYVIDTLRLNRNGYSLRF